MKPKRALSNRPEVQMSPNRLTRRLSHVEALALWRRWHDEGRADARDRLVFAFLPMVRLIVFRKARELPARCEVDDLVSSGIEAMIRALGRFDPERGVPLEQFI